MINNILLSGITSSAGSSTNSLPVGGAEGGGVGQHNHSPLQYAIHNSHTSRTKQSPNQVRFFIEVFATKILKILFSPYQTFFSDKFQG